MNTTKESEFDYQTYLKENRPDPARINRGPKARQKRREAVVCNIRGLSYYEDGLYDCAIEDFTKAIKAKPDFVEAYNNRGIAYVSKGKYDCAIEDFTKAIIIKPEFVEGYNNRGVAYAE